MLRATSRAARPREEDGCDTVDFSTIAAETLWQRYCPADPAVTAFKRQTAYAALVSLDFGVDSDVHDRTH